VVESGDAMPPRTTSPRSSATPRRGIYPYLAHECHRRRSPRTGKLAVGVSADEAIEQL
jgi:hypothetical protein